jgi:hypothetical protein
MAQTVTITLTVVREVRVEVFKGLLRLAQNTLWPNHRLGRLSINLISHCLGCLSISPLSGSALLSLSTIHALEGDFFLN